METIILILLVFLTFLSELIAFSSLKNARGFAFALIGFISAIIGSLIVFFTKESGLQSSYLFFPEWFLISFFGGLILAIPVLQKRADILLLKLSDVTYKSRRWVLLLLIPYFFLFYISTLSIQVNRSCLTERPAV
jgi:hypothetical protein